MKAREVSLPAGQLLRGLGVGLFAFLTLSMFLLLLLQWLPYPITEACGRYENEGGGMLVLSPERYELRTSRGDVVASGYWMLSERRLHFSERRDIQLSSKVDTWTLDYLAVPQQFVINRKFPGPDLYRQVEPAECTASSP